MELCKSFVTPKPLKSPNSPLNLIPKSKSFVCFSSKPMNSTANHRIKLAESLQEETLKILEWPSVCNQVSAFTSTTMGFSAARDGLIPIGRSRDETRKLIAQTTAALQVPLQLDFSGIQDVSDIVKHSVAGRLLSIGEICAVKRTLESARLLYEQLKRVSLDCDRPERYSSLLEILQNCNFLTALEQKIGYCIDCKFSMILDRASEELEIIRSERKRNMEILESLLKQKSNKIFQSGGIDKPLVTKRRSRMCVGIRASRKSLLPDGVILDVSSSGATYFMEPKEAVDLNNMEVRLLNSERDEEMAILSLFTSEIAESQIAIKYLLDRVLEVDFAFARASHARWINGVCPILSFNDHKNIRTFGTGSLSIDIEGIQHPLLIETSLKCLSDIEASKSRPSVPWHQGNGAVDPISSVASTFPVPIDIKVEYGTSVVVISGPNTGGKTASMKTLGLASVMLKAGMYLPARNHPILPWFDLILADIGDQQSLEQNLSTFSGHLSRICKILEVTSDESLVLIDEIGSGTDPSEGVALSASILDFLKARVNLAVVTTHYSDLSRLKEKDSKFENAAMEFSLETLQPTYQILWGSTGESNALTIAKSIGFDEAIVNRAQTWVGKMMPEKAEKMRGLLYQSLMEERNRLESQANTAASIHSSIMDLYHEIRDEADNLLARETALKAKETQQIQKEINAVKSQIQRVVEDFENRFGTASFDQLNSLLKESETEIQSILEAHSSTHDFSVSNPDISQTTNLGDEVLVQGLGNKLATIVEAPAADGTVLVQYGKIRVRVNISNIRPAPNSDTSTTTESLPRFTKQGQRIRSLKSLLEPNTNKKVSYGPVLQTSKNTVDLRGMRVEEASNHLDLAISTSGSNSVLFIIHGMGTGVVKERALEILRKHPRIAKFEQESPMNYGCTIAYIK